jgi:hypothetical protein
VSLTATEAPAPEPAAIATAPSADEGRATPSADEGRAVKTKKSKPAHHNRAATRGKHR